MKKTISFIISIILIACSFSACSKNEQNINFIYPIEGNINSYDPQVASTKDEYLLIENTFEGLVRVNDDGTVQEGVAKEWSISDDGLTYTFKLRDDAKWRINDAIKERMGEDLDPTITARDFVFGLRRAVMPETKCPLFPTISCIKNATKINSGYTSSDYLGVTASDDTTLVIELETPNDKFLEVLSTSVAMPCNEQFFNATNGRYGLEAKYTLFNGQFYLRQVLESSYLLRSNESYTGKYKTFSTKEEREGTIDKEILSKPQRIELSLKIIDDKNRDKTFELLEKGYYDAAFINGSDSEKIRHSSGVTYYPYIDTTWGFVFNTNDEIFQNELMREAFCKGISRKDTFKQPYYSNATSFAPPSCTVADTTIENLVNNGYAQDNEKSIELWNKGLKKLKYPEINITIITPEDKQDIVKEFLQGIQSGIGAISSYENGKPMKFSLKVEKVTQDELMTRLSTGDYDIAFCPFKAEYQSAISFYQEFTETNYTGFSNNELTKSIDKCNQSSDNATVKQGILDCENAIYESHTIYPVMFESSYYACAKGVTGIQFHTGSGRVSFVNATIDN